MPERQEEMYRNRRSSCCSRMVLASVAIQQVALEYARSLYLELGADRATCMLRSTLWQLVTRPIRRTIAMSDTPTI